MFGTNYNYSITFFFTFVIIVELQNGFVMPAGKYIHRRDVSEFCRRRVISSVFLGRHVMDAESEVLYFSRLELPYSCSISVRAESGSNIILVIQIGSDYNLKRACNVNHNQLLVYEIGETFGGYWGPLPDSVMRQKSHNHTKIYTLQPYLHNESRYHVSSSDDSSGYDDIKKLHSTKKIVEITQHIMNVKDNDEYIQLEVPLVNISGDFVFDDIKPRNSYNFDDLFDIMDNVTPRKGMNYDTSIVPLVQFSKATSKIRVHQDQRNNFKHEMVYIPGTYTPDSRLEFSTIFTRRHFRKSNQVFVNRRLNFKKRPLFSGKKTSLPLKEFRDSYRWQSIETIKPKHILDVTTPNFHSTWTVSEKTLETNAFGHTGEPHKIIEDIMTLLKINQTTRSLSNDKRILIQKISNIQHNSSVYLVTNLHKEYKNNFLPSFTKEGDIIDDLHISTKSIAMLRTNNITVSRDAINYVLPVLSKNTLNRQPDYFNETITQTLRETTSLNSKSVKKSNINKSSDSFKNVTSMAEFSNATPATGSKGSTISTNFNRSINITENKANNLSQIIENPSIHSNSSFTVHHKSWENVVQAAPVMVILLNETSSHTKNNTSVSKSIIEPKVVSNVYIDPQRNKRYIQPINIEVARPRVYSPIDDTLNVTQLATHHVIDMQDIAHLVELQDDEIQGRVALRYIRNYVGSVLLNICDHTEAKSRRVYLFNTSRIVIAISNFTLDDMTVVMTPARTLKNTIEAQCPEAQVECQISGTRVCIDAINACNGIPNCGAQDIYDEDRLLCGVIFDLQHNVYLAAIAFLAVLLTALYTVHYWLKRCVPRVSEAFFVYTDRSENILNLESVMRSPNDEDDSSKMVYRGQLFDDDIMDIDIEKGQRNICLEYWNSFCAYFCKTPKETEIIEDTHSKVNRMFSFAQIELDKMTTKKTVDTCVQTAESLEKPNFNFYEIENSDSEHLKNKRDSYVQLDYKAEKVLSQQKHLNELSLLKFMRESRSDSIQSNYTLIENLKESDNIGTILEQEKELRITVYEPQTKVISSQEHAITRCDVHSENPKVSHRKHLRFDEEATTIPSLDEQRDEIEEADIFKPRNITFGTERLRQSDLDTNEVLPKPSNSSTRDFSRFWTGKRGTKSKKKTHVTLNKY